MKPHYEVQPNGRTKTKWDVVNANTDEVIATFPNNGAAFAYAKRLNSGKVDRD